MAAKQRRKRKGPGSFPVDEDDPLGDVRDILVQFLDMATCEMCLGYGVTIQLDPQGAPLRDAATGRLRVGGPCDCRREARALVQEFLGG